jgi:hypothetical protein
MRVGGFRSLLLILLLPCCSLVLALAMSSTSVHNPEQSSNPLSHQIFQEPRIFSFLERPFWGAESLNEVQFDSHFTRHFLGLGEK